MSDPGELVSQGIVARLRTLLLVLDRQDRLEHAQAFVGWLEGEASGERLTEHARELLLRALRIVGDPLNYSILRRLDPIEPVEIPELMEQTGLSRVAISERVNDLLQTGLAVREMVNDQVRGTDLGSGLRDLVEKEALAAGSCLASELSASVKAGEIS